MQRGGCTAAGRGPAKRQVSPDAGSEVKSRQPAERVRQRSEADANLQVQVLQKGARSLHDSGSEAKALQLPRFTFSGLANLPMESGSAVREEQPRKPRSCNAAGAPNDSGSEAKALQSLNSTS